MSRPELGQMAPDFELSSDDGASVRLSGLRGRPVVLYFYPKDDTPGCTTEACDFRDRQAEIALAGNAAVFGVSPDSVKSHAKFKAKYQLPFALLADPDKAVLTAYGAWGEKKLYGKTVVGVIRSTFIVKVDAKGKATIEQAMYAVKATGHVARLRKDLGI